MTIEIRFVQLQDKAFWFGLDRHLPETEFAKKIRDRQGYVLLENGEPQALLRWNLFWDNTPFCTMLYVVRGARGKGYGRRLTERWENDMREQGHGMVLSSTRVDEDARHFWRKLGYKDCGGLTADVPGYEQPMELFFRKAL